MAGIAARVRIFERIGDQADMRLRFVLRRIAPTVAVPTGVPMSKCRVPICCSTNWVCRLMTRIAGRFDIPTLGAR